MDPIIIAFLCFLSMFVLILLQVPIGVAMGAIGVIGFTLMSSFDSALSVLGGEVVSNITSLDLAVIPLFILMGNFSLVSGVSSEMYSLANGFLGHHRGGLAMATIGGCGLFGAVCGSSLATTATFGQVALPEMIKRGYSPVLATGTIAAGGNLGSLVPPSVILVIYAVLCELSIIDLFLAAIIPVVLTILLYFITIAVYVRLKSSAGSVGSRLSWANRISVVINSWSAILLLFGIAGGIYGGVFTVPEAASLGVILSLLLVVFRGKLSLPVLRKALVDTAATTAMIYTILIGATTFNYAIVLTSLPEQVASSIVGSGFSTAAIIISLLLFYIVAGSIFDTVAAMIITLPFVYPIIIGMGFSPIWWGVINLVVIEIGMMTPPLGMNVFVLQGVAIDYPLTTIYRGVVPFLCADAVRLSLLVLFPWLATWLPTLFQ